MHTIVQESFNSLPHLDLRLKVPRCYEYIGSANNWWSLHGLQFPSDYQEPGKLLLTARIVPLPKLIRDAFIDLYFRTMQRMNKATKIALLGYILENAVTRSVIHRRCLL